MRSKSVMQLSFNKKTGGKEFLLLIPLMKMTWGCTVCSSAAVNVYLAMGMVGFYS